MKRKPEVQFAYAIYLDTDNQDLAAQQQAPPSLGVAAERT